MEAGGAVAERAAAVVADIVVAAVEGYTAGTAVAAVAMAEVFAAVAAAAAVEGILAGGVAAAAAGTDSRHFVEAGHTVPTVVAARMSKWNSMMAVVAEVEAGHTKPRRMAAAGAAGSGSWAAGPVAIAGMQADLGGRAGLAAQAVLALAVLLLLLRSGCAPPTVRPRKLVVVVGWHHTTSCEHRYPVGVEDSVLLGKGKHCCCYCRRMGAAVRAVGMVYGAQTLRRCAVVFRCPLVEEVVPAVAVAVADSVVAVKEDTRARPALVAAEERVVASGMPSVLVVQVRAVVSGGQ